MTLAHFVDNRAANTLDTALGARLASARATGGPIQLDIAAGFFDLDGFQKLHPYLRAGDKVRLLLGAEPPRECDLPRPRPGDATGPERDRELLAAALRALDTGLAAMLA